MFKQVRYAIIAICLMLCISEVHAFDYPDELLYSTYFGSSFLFYI